MPLFPPVRPIVENHPRLHRFFYPLKPWEEKLPAGQLPSGEGVLSLKVTLPPTMVVNTRMSRMVSVGTVKISSLKMARSA